MLIGGTKPGDWWYRERLLLSYGTFATVYDDVVVVLPIAHPEAFDDGEPGTYRMI